MNPTSRHFFNTQFGDVHYMDVGSSQSPPIILLHQTPRSIDEFAEVIPLLAAGHRVVAGSEEIKLGPTEYRLLKFFVTHPDRVYSRTQLLDRVWGANVYVEERTVDVHVRRLRKALSPSGADDYIQTVRGAGYRFSTKGD